MNEKTLNYKIVDKNGKVVEDLTFNDFDKLADHMLEMADKYYQGVLSSDDSVSISAFDDSGNLLYEDKASFKGAELDEDVENGFRSIISENSDAGIEELSEESE